MEQRRDCSRLEQLEQQLPKFYLHLNFNIMSVSRAIKLKYESSFSIGIRAHHKIYDYESLLLAPFVWVFLNHVMSVFSIAIPFSTRCFQCLSHYWEHNK